MWPYLGEGRGFVEQSFFSVNLNLAGCILHETLWEVLHVTLKKYEKLRIVRV